MRGPPTHEHRSTLRNDYSSSGDTRHGSPTSSSGPSPNHRRPQRGNGRRGASHGRRDCRRNICSSCRDRNKRCDGLQPVCGLCARHPTENPCTYPESDCGNSRRQDREDNVFRATSHFPQDENLNAVVNDHNTTNYGEGSHTYNGSHGTTSLRC
ncbi:hypothetical protein L218DRAFT_69133 [Marasmius fiardii PR-910]|nr:hypothetical protein L218DRAFT_69133 [Marasmius fiardii PR-910]